MDAFAVSIATGISLQKVNPCHALTVALSFGAFQAFMPVVGWFGGAGVKSIIAPIDHWIAFGLLSIIGVRMIYESRRCQQDKKGISDLRAGTVLILSIATSIDALVAGISFSLLNTPIFLPALVIGSVTFALSFTGVYIGRSLGLLFERAIHIAGGLILIGIGIKILLEHLQSI
jgi:putative Mn2+ efflux pump MntP